MLGLVNGYCRRSYGRVGLYKGNMERSPFVPKVCSGGTDQDSYGLTCFQNSCHIHQAVIGDGLEVLCG